MAIGLRALADNSFLTHLATGRLIVDDGRIPTRDPYTFTAHGHPWVVQSWLASLLYGLADRVAGFGGVRVVVGLLTLGVFAMAWRLARPAEGVLVRCGIAALVLGIGTEEWSGRPLLIGLLALGATMLAADGELDPRWLVPIGWVWVNSHGSFPLGIAYLVVVAVGRRLDREDTAVELRCLRWLVGGTLVGAVNPLGPRLLLFPIELLQRQDVLHNVIEWQAPRFTTISERVFLLELALAIVAVARRPTYRAALLVTVFVAAALLGSRNVAVASLVLVPVLASAWSGVGQLRNAARTSAARTLGLVGLIGLVVVPVVRLGQADVALGPYPTQSLAYLQHAGVDLEAIRLVSIDRVGNLLELQHGAGRRVFFDDRFDMFPDQVSADAFALTVGRPSSTAILDRYRIDLVLWPKDAALTAILQASSTWRPLPAQDPAWSLLCRRSATLGPALGSC